MSTEPNPDSLPAWHQLERQQQLQQSEPADLTTLHESELPPDENEEEDDAPPSHPRERREITNAAVEGDDVVPEEELEEAEEEADLIEDKIEFKIRNDFGDEQTQEVLIRGHKDAVERVKQQQMLHADHTRKTQELARQRDGIADAVRQAQDQGRTQYVQQLETLKHTVLARLEPELNGVDLQKLAVEDPLEYNRLTARATALGQTLQQIEQEQRKVAEKQAQEDVSSKQERIQLAQNALMDPTSPWYVSEWSNNYYSQLLTNIHQKYGFSLDEVAQVIDPRIIKLMSDVTKYHQGTDRRAIARKQIARTPKAIPAGPAPAPTRTMDSRLEGRFRRTGSIEDGAKLLESRLKQRPR